jgi:hypothetical protein
MSMLRASDNIASPSDRGKLLWTISKASAIASTARITCKAFMNPCDLSVWWQQAK